MRKLRCILFILLVLTSEGVLATVEHESVLRIHYGGSWLQDQYLAPVLYTGQKVGIGGDMHQVFKRHPDWSHVGKIDMQFHWLYNPAYTNVIYSAGVAGGWGAGYNWHLWGNHIHLLLGPYLDFDYLARWHVRNVNKPYSMDIALDLMAQGSITYTFKGKKSSYRLRYWIRANLIGVDFVPDYWQSYYELTEGIAGHIRCSGMWNHRTLRHELTLDLQFAHSTWRVGIVHEYLEYGIKGLLFSREQVAAVVGTCFRFKTNPSPSLAPF